MPYFAYKARDTQGRIQQGVIEAINASALADSLRSSGWIVLEVKPGTMGEGSQGGLPPSWHPHWLLPMTSLDVELGFRQLASMLRSGVSILAALATVAEQATRPRAAAVWLAVESYIRKGGNISNALEQHSRVFNEYVAQLLRVGEHSGELEVSLTRAADHLEFQRDLRMMVINALIYPLIATLMAGGVTIYLVVVVIPKIANFLESNNAELPQITQMLINVAYWLRLHGLSVLAVSVGLIVAWVAVRRHPLGREGEDTLLLRLPVVGHILRLSQTAVFARGLSLLIESGVTLLDALGVLEKLLSNRRFGRRINDARQRVMRGESLADSLSEAKEFFPLLLRMTAVAEVSGTLGSTLTEVAVFHEKMLIMAIRRFNSLIEPLMIVVTGGIVGFVYIAFFMALFSMVSSI